MWPILILCAVIALLFLALLYLLQRRNKSTPPAEHPPLDAEAQALQEELAQRLQAVQEKEEEFSDQLVYENYVEGRFSHLLAIAIQGVITENSPTVSAIEKALGPRAGDICRAPILSPQCGRGDYKPLLYAGGERTGGRL